jgi:hypothetical protein
MGRHSSPEQGPFFRSVLAWFMPWLLISVVVGVAVWILVNALAGEEIKPVTADVSPTPTAKASPAPSQTEMVIATPEPSKKPRKDPKPKRTKDPGPPPLITEAVNIQVLNGTGDTSVDDRIAAKLEGLGFRIEAIDESSAAYPRTTVFWSYPEAQEAAERLAARFGWLVDEKPDNLSTTVAVHVVVGEDEV